MLFPLINQGETWDGGQFFSFFLVQLYSWVDLAHHLSVRVGLPSLSCPSLPCPPNSDLYLRVGWDGSMSLDPTPPTHTGSRPLY